MNNLLLVLVFFFTLSLSVLSGLKAMSSSEDKQESAIQILVSRTFMVRLLLWTAEYMLYTFPLFKTTKDRARKPFMQVEYQEANRHYYSIVFALLVMRIVYIIVFGIPFAKHHIAMLQQKTQGDVFQAIQLHMAMQNTKAMAYLWIQFVIWMFLALDSLIVLSFFVGGLVMWLVHALEIIKLQI